MPDLCFHIYFDYYFICSVSISEGVSIMQDFQSFGKIENINRLRMTITQKIHGTNAQVYIYDDEDGGRHLKCGSRTRWITPHDDNYGFATHVYAHREEFIEKLGLGRHFGEWAGKGINSGEGLECRNFYLFNHWKFGEKFKAQCENPELKLLPPNTFCVPVLWRGEPSHFREIVVLTLDWLKLRGSSLHGAHGFKRPEGIVIQIGDQYFKKVFNPEETQWTKGQEKKFQAVLHDFSDLLQPIRLEKLFSQDERYMRDYPKSLPEIVKSYVQDLMEEQQCTEEVGKAASRHIFAFVKQHIGDINGKSTQAA